MNETIGIKRPYNTEMESEELLLVSSVELEKDWRTLCFLVSCAIAVNKNHCWTVVMFGLEMKTNIASSAELLEYNRYFCHWTY